MVAMHLAKAVGGNMLLGFLAAVAFATILAVVSGLALAAPRRSRTTSMRASSARARQPRRKRCAFRALPSIGLGMLAIVLGILFEKMNIAFMVGLAFGIAAAANFPVLILSMYWKGLTTRGALWGGYGGLHFGGAVRALLEIGVGDVLGNKARRCSPTRSRRCSRCRSPSSSPTSCRRVTPARGQGRDRGLR
jgi:cation/acetate symporter